MGNHLIPDFSPQLFKGLYIAFLTVVMYTFNSKRITVD